ncbi:MAG: hypothetical protein EPN50_03685 [Chloroflexota bacterium]|nr:MAG: hypothetical protein EPN50_03685 [Chloroflexota bacterium]
MTARRHAWLATPIDPGLLATALLGWLVRGGLLVVVVPLLAIPSPVGLSVLVGPDIVDATGISARVRGLLVAGAVLLAAALAVALLASAWAEGQMASRLDAGTSSGPEPGRRPGRAGLIGISLVALVPLGLAAAAAAGELIAVGTQELIFPSRLDVPFVLRVLEGARGGVALLIAATVVADLINAVAARRYLRPAGPTAARPGASAIGALLEVLPWTLRHPLRALGTAAVAWGLTVAASAVAIAVLGDAWSGLGAIARPAIGRPDLISGLLSGLFFVVGSLILAALLGVVLVILGLVATIRGRLWTRAVDGA